MLDNLKGVLIFLVVFGHSLELCKENSLVIKIIYMFIYLFHMPVFVFISGYFSKNLDKSRNKAFRNFLVPYLIFNTLWNIVSIPVVGIENFSLLTPGWALWYLISMFYWRISLKDIIRIKYIFPISLVIGVLAGLSSEFDTFLSLSRSLFFFPFFLGGYYTTEKQLIQFRQRKIGLITIILTITFLAAIILAYSDILPIEFLYSNQSFAEFSLVFWLGILGRIFLYIIGFSFVYILVNVVKPTKTFFTNIGFNTFPVYILHTYVVAVVFAINYYIPWVFLQLLVCGVTSAFITYILSRNSVMKYFNKIISKFVGLFAR